MLLSYCCVLFVFPFSRNPTRYQGGENAGILPECAFRGVAVIRVCVTLKREQQRSVWSPSPPFQERLNNNCSPTVLQVEWMSKAPVPPNEQSRLRDYAAKAHPRAELFLRGNDIFSSKQLVPILSQTHLYKGRNKKKKSLTEGILFLSAEAAEAGKSSSRYPRITGESENPLVCIARKQQRLFTWHFWHLYLSAKGDEEQVTWGEGGRGLTFNWRVKPACRVSLSFLLNSRWSRIQPTEFFLLKQKMERKCCANPGYKFAVRCSFPSKN